MPFDYFAKPSSRNFIPLELGRRAAAKSKQNEEIPNGELDGNDEEVDLELIGKAAKGGPSAMSGISSIKLSSSEGEEPTGKSKRKPAVPKNSEKSKKTRVEEAASKDPEQSCEGSSTLLLAQYSRYLNVFL